MELAIGQLKSHASGERYQKFLDHLSDQGLLLYNIVRTKIVKAAMEYMVEHDFVHPPVYMFSTLTDPLNHETYPARFDYYGKEHSLIQSLIFHKMAIVSVSNIKRVFWLSPNIRLEASPNGEKYATEFTQLDFEVSGWDVEQAIYFTKGLISHVIKELNCNSEFNIECLRNLKREAYDYREGLEYKNFDFEINGLEVCSGAQREYEYDRLKARMEELNYPLDYFEPVLRMAENGLLKPSAGAGIGIERLTRAILGLRDMSKIYPFARRPKEDLVL